MQWCSAGAMVFSGQQILFKTIFQWIETEIGKL
jgi:hypothetical protein